MKEAGVRVSLEILGGGIVYAIIPALVPALLAVSLNILGIIVAQKII